MILVTGANGWLGYNLISLISNKETEKWGLKNDKIIAFVERGTNKNNLLKFKNVKIIEGNLSDKKDLHLFLSYSNHSILIHTTGIIHPSLTKTFFEINYKITKNLINLLNNYSIKKTIILSSNSVNGFNKNNRLAFDEKSKYNPYLKYGKSKYLMEKEVIKSMKENNITIIRCPWFYGKYQPKRQKLMLQMIKKNRFPIIGDGNNLRSMVYLNNLVQGVALASSKEISRSKIYWIADADPYSMNYLVNTIKKIYKENYNFKITDKNIYLPNIISYIARKLDFIFQFFGFYNSRIHVLGELNMNIFCNIDRAIKELDYKPEYSLYEGMKESIKEIND